MAGLVSYDNGLLRANSLDNAIEYSGNGGYSWTPRSFCHDFGRLNDLIAVDDKLYACGSNGFFYSGNRGYSWTMLASSNAYGSFLRISFDGLSLIAETSKGVMKSGNGGYTWSLISSR